MLMVSSSANEQYCPQTQHLHGHKVQTRQKSKNRKKTIKTKRIARPKGKCRKINQAFIINIVCYFLVAKQSTNSKNQTVHCAQSC